MFMPRVHALRVRSRGCPPCRSWRSSLVRGLKFCTSQGALRPRVLRGATRRGVHALPMFGFGGLHHGQSTGWRLSGPGLKPPSRAVPGLAVPQAAPQRRPSLRVRKRCRRMGRAFCSRSMDMVGGPPPAKSGRRAADIRKGAPMPPVPAAEQGANRPPAAKQGQYSGQWPQISASRRCAPFRRFGGTTHVMGRSCLRSCAASLSCMVSPMGCRRSGPFECRIAVGR